VPFGGQTAGLIGEVLPVHEIIDGMVRDAEQRLLALARSTAGVAPAA
jgi:hypothetical protein